VLGVAVARNWGLALLKADDIEHPCVYFDEDVSPGDSIYAVSGSHDSSHGNEAIFDFDGHSSTPPLLRLKGRSAMPGIIGAPALNLRTGGVCGIVKGSRDDVGQDALAIPLSTVTFVCQKLKLGEQQIAYHKANTKWVELLVSNDFERWVRPTNIADLARYLYSADEIERRYGIGRRLDETGIHSSTIALVIARILHDFPVDQLTRESLSEGHSVSDLYRAVDELIDRFQRLCDEIVEVLVEARFDKRPYGSAYGISEARLAAANRKLHKTSRDMHDIAAPLGQILSQDSVLKQRLAVIAALVAEIAVIEDFLVVGFSDVSAGDTGRPERRFRRKLGYMLTEADEHLVQAYQSISCDLDNYRNRLRLATAGAMALQESSPKSSKTSEFFLWRMPWRRTGTILVGLATVAAAVAAILTLVVK
jgi:hypothetical protein